MCIKEINQSINKAIKTLALTRRYKMLPTYILKQQRSKKSLLRVDINTHLAEKRFKETAVNVRKMEGRMPTQ